MDKYIDFVIEVAENKGFCFIMDTGDGREVYDKRLAMQIEDLSGWLLPLEDRDDFIKHRLMNKSLDYYRSYYTLAKWLYNDVGELCIEFINYDEYDMGKI